MSAVNIKDFKYKWFGLCGSLSQKKQQTFPFMRALMLRLNKYRARGLVQLWPPSMLASSQNLI